MDKETALAVATLMNEKHQLEKTVASLISVVGEALAIAEREGHYSAAQQIRAMARDLGVSIDPTGHVPPRPGPLKV